MQQQFTIPGGNKKGTPINAAEVKDIEYWVNRIGGDLEKDPNKKFADRDREWVAAGKAELERRKGGGAKAAAPATQPKPQQSAALATTQSAGMAVAGAWHEARAVDAELRKASQSMFLVSPATVCGALPEGCEVAISVVHVDPSTEKTGPGDVYPVGGGKLGLSGNTLKRIGAAAGIDWDVSLSGRLDNGSDPHYCHFRAVGYVRNFDGSIRTLSGEVEIDARDGSPQIDEIRKKAAGRENSDGGDSQILELRKFLLRHAESKAKNRAIADMGIKRSYTAEELHKPFAVARLMATGRTNDPELRKEFARMNFDKMTSGRAALYGPAAETPRLSAPAAHTQPFSGHSPPPVGTIADDPNDPGGYDYEVEGSATQTPLPADGGDADRGNDPNAY